MNKYRLKYKLPVGSGIVRVATISANRQQLFDLAAELMIKGIPSVLGPVR